MSNKVIAFQKPNKTTLTLRVPVARSVEEELELVKQIDPKAKIIDRKDVPTTRIFRNAWKTYYSQVTVDLEKAKVMHLDRLREKRNKKLEELDKEQLQNLSNPAELNRLEAEKQSFRDLPATVDLTNFDPDDPVKDWPPELELHDIYK